MSNNGRKIVAPVTYKDPYEVMKVAKHNGIYDVGYICTHENVSKWSMEKPMEKDSPNVPTEDEKLAINWGVDVPYFTIKEMCEKLKECDVVETDSEGNLSAYYDFGFTEWKYGVPSEWYRLLDFNGYTHGVRVPFGVSDDGVTEWPRGQRWGGNSFVALPTYIETRFYPDIEGGTDFEKMQLRYYFDETYNPDSFGRLNNCYAGLAIFKFTNEWRLSYISAEQKVSELEYGPEDYKLQYYTIGDNSIIERYAVLMVVPFLSLTKVETTSSPTGLDDVVISPLEYLIRPFMFQNRKVGVLLWRQGYGNYFLLSDGVFTPAEPWDIPVKARRLRFEYDGQMNYNDFYGTTDRDTAFSWLPVEGDNVLDGTFSKVLFETYAEVEGGMHNPIRLRIEYSGLLERTVYVEMRYENVDTPGLQYGDWEVMAGLPVLTGYSDLNGDNGVEDYFNSGGFSRPIFDIVLTNQMEDGEPAALVLYVLANSGRVDSNGYGILDVYAAECQVKSTSNKYATFRETDDNGALVNGLKHILYTGNTVVDNHTIPYGLYAEYTVDAGIPDDWTSDLKGGYVIDGV